MKTLLTIALFCSAAVAQSNMTCTQKIYGDVCTFDDGRVNVSTYSAPSGSYSSTWYTAEEWETIGPMLEQSARHPQGAPRPYGPQVKCEAAGGEWSNLRFHKCKMPPKGYRFRTQVKLPDGTTEWR